MPNPLPWELPILLRITLWGGIYLLFPHTSPPLWLILFLKFYLDSPLHQITLSGTMRKNAPFRLNLCTILLLSRLTQHPPPLHHLRIQISHETRYGVSLSPQKLNISFGRLARMSSQQKITLEWELLTLIPYVVFAMRKLKPLIIVSFVVGSSLKFGLSLIFALGQLIIQTCLSHLGCRFMLVIPLFFRKKNVFYA